MKKSFCLLFLIVFLGITSTFAQAKAIKNIIFMIPDGTSIDVLALARWYNNALPLAVDPYIRGLVKTHCSDTPIGDSAPTSSTYSTGHLSRTGFVATYPDSVMLGYNIVATDPKRQFSPMFTMLEAAKLQQKSTGLVFTCYFPHATPADFSAHSQHRDNYDLLSRQMVYNNIDVVFGGGSSFLKPDKRTDKLDLAKVLNENKITLLQTPSQMQAFSGNRVWGLFAPQALKNDLDRNPAEEPSLAEMTKKAIELLSQNKNGFFMMVEGSKVDWSAHDNDPIGMVTEFLAFDKAVKVALDFAKADGNTLVIVVPDHGNSGISIGNSKCNNGYDELTLKELMNPLLNAKNTVEAINDFINSKSTPDQIRSVFADRYGVNNLTTAEMDAIQACFGDQSTGGKPKSKKSAYALQKLTAEIFNRRTYIGFTTTGHTGEDVFLSIYSPENNAPTGLMLNSEVNRYMQQTWSVNLDSLTDTYFVPHATVFEGYTQSIDSTDKFNRVLIVKSGKTTLRIPENKNVVFVNEVEQKFPTLMVYNGISFYVPMSLRKLL
jgi:alkaline phosphatase